MNECLSFVQVKPRNVVLSEDHKTLKLCDFGIAIKLEAGKKDKGSMRQIGTTNYMAPEILEGLNGNFLIDTRHINNDI
jgi:serine/threonine-protein kinase